MSKITEYAAATRFDSGDILIKDGSNGTKKITAENAAVEFAGLVSTIQHRNVYRGKNLGTSVTAAQKTAIQNGSFDDLFIGDYWVIGSKNWVIADMDYWYNIGDTSFASHHLVIVPSTTLGNVVMNDTNTTEGGYVGSKMYTEGLDTAKSLITECFGDMVKSHRLYLSNAVTDGVESAGAWADSTVDLMSEIMVYGTKIRNTGHIATADKQQLALFRLSPRAINIRSNYWLRDVVSATLFAVVHGDGYANYGYASNTSYGVRPAFAIG